MKRRLFIQGALSSLFIPASVMAATAKARAATLPDTEFIFHDERFPEARRLAASLGDAARLTPVQGDVTGIWREQVQRACRQAPLRLAGVTTESFHFCLARMVNSTTHMNSTLSRISRDLYLWHIQVLDDQTRLTGI